MSNYPIGAEHDPAAPWNEDVFFCKDCHSSEIVDYIDKHIKTLTNVQEIGDLSDYEYNAVFDSVYHDMCKEAFIGLCASCHYQEIADLRDD